MSELNEMQQIMEEKGTPTLKAIAMVFDLPPVRLYSVAKQPKEGEVYDAKVYNWDAIERFVTRRLEPDTNHDSLESVVAAALELDEELKLKDGRRSANKGTSNRTIEVDGKSIAARKFSTFEQDAGKFICLKSDPRVYKIVYQTQSHTVIVPVSDAEGTVASQDVKAISNGMLNLKGIGPGAIDDAVAERFEAMETADAQEADAE